LDWRKSVLAKLEWLGMEKVSFCLNGTAWNEEVGFGLTEKERERERLGWAVLVCLVCAREKGRRYRGERAAKGRDGERGRERKKERE
jgi:hypothetical protein